MTTTRPADSLKEELLRAAAAAIAADDEDAASALLDRLRTEHLDLDRSPRDLTFHIFATALGRRLAWDAADSNLYLRHFDLSQISLFNLLAERLPLVRLGGALGNAVLAATMPAGREIALLDIGIGTGQQEVALIGMLARRKGLPSKLRVVAVEPSAASVHEAERAIREAATAADLALDFTAIEGVIEALSETEWAALRDATVGAHVVVNAAFALHHIQGPNAAGPMRAREDVLRRVATLDPHAVVLIEPNSDHHEPDFLARFERCWWHFGTVFRLIDRLDVEQEADRAAMKLFFAREIDDILANDEVSRTERHEPTSRWIERLLTAGLHPATGLEPLAVTEEHGISVQSGPGYAGIAIDGDLMVSVICAGSEPLTLQLGAPNDGAWPALATSAAAASSRVRVRDVMSADPATISQDATLAEAAQLLWESAASDLVVLDSNDRFAGVLSEGDIIRRLFPSPAAPAERNPDVEAFELLVLRGHHAAPQPIAPLVIRDAITLKPTDDLLRVVSEMIGRQIRRLPVVDRSGKLVGSVTRADVCRALLQI